MNKEKLYSRTLAIRMQDECYNDIRDLSLEEGMLMSTFARILIKRGLESKALRKKLEEIRKKRKK